MTTRLITMRKYVETPKWKLKKSGFIMVGTAPNLKRAISSRNSTFGAGNAKKYTRIRKSRKNENESLYTIWGKWRPE